ncbi:FG-GAP repeat domain-containing protein [Bacteroidota bacterium]
MRKGKNIFQRNRINMKVRHFLIIPFYLLIANLLSAQDVWREDSFEDFADGIFSDAGANMYVSHNGRIQTINRWDVNNDGAVDILCVNSHPLVEMLDMSVYWSNGKDFSIQNHSYIPANGPMWVTADDLNNDGEMDLVVANYSNGTWTEMESFVYYGGLDKNDNIEDGEWGHYPFKRKLLLPSANAQKAVTGDFNKDGYKDIVIAFSGGFWEYRDKSREGTSASRIYWGGNDDFNPDRFTNIITAGATDVVSADFNSDGWLDLAFANGEGKSSFVYYGSESGFTDSSMVELPTIKAHAVEVGDIDNNGSLDVIFACEQGTTSFGYQNKNGSFDSDKKIEFETYTAKDVVVEDFNKDGFNDVFFTNHKFSLSGDPNLANRLIDSYIYFGSAKGFSEENKQPLPTIGAWGANAADLNNDGWVDLLVCNFQEHYSYEVPSYIYWNSSEGFKKSLRTCLYEHGAQGNTIADLNNDGNLDILITSMMGDSRGGYDPSFLYLGREDGSMDIENRIELTSREAYEQAFADLNDDSQVDILLINRGETTRQTNEVFIYWNKNYTFDQWNISGLPSHNGLGVQVADLDRNGFLDIIVSNGSSLNTTQKSSSGSFIYWGGESGWAVTDRTELPTKMTRSCAVADINYDGNLDLIFGDQAGGMAVIFHGDGTRNYLSTNSFHFMNSKGTGNPEVADLNNDDLLDVVFAHNKNVLVYYQNEDYKFGDPIVLPIQAKTMTIADVNNDGWLDLVCPFYKGKSNRTDLSSVLLGSKNGFDVNNSIKFLTDGGTGSLVCDFNRDGYKDVFFYCHRTDGSFDEVGRYGDHHVNSLLYWGSASGFSNENVQKIPSIGAHYDMGTDLGNVMDRTNIYLYVSSPYFMDGKNPVELRWEGDTPLYSSIKFQVRTAESENDLQRADWLGPGGEGSYFTEDYNRLKNFSGNWIQYRVLFKTGNGAGSPLLNRVEIEFE